MNTNEIQELFDGDLGDERMAEVLHVLSVSPEKRAAFRQHMALRNVIEQDRLENGLKSDEDALIWGAIIGGGGGVISSGSSSVWGSWLMRGTAAIAIGVVGYILGSTSWTDVTVDDSNGSAVVDNSRVRNSGAGPATVAPVQSAPSAPTVVYRDRIVRVEVPVQSAVPTGDARPLDGSTELLAADGGNRNGDGTTTDETIGSASGSSQSLGSASRDGSGSGSPTTATEEGTDLNISSSSAPQHVAIGADRQMPLKSDTAASHGSRDNGEDLASRRRSLVMHNGLELVYSERVGRLMPTPPSMRESDPDFSNRSVGALFRFGDGSWGVGTRFVYGTLATVQLVNTGTNFAEGNDWGPTLKAEKKFWVEVVGNYRLPLADDLALSFEASAGAATNSLMFGVDAGVLWNITERIGVQGGIGLGGYSYDLRAERKRLMEQSRNDGISSDASDVYEGTILQGRYGLYYRF